MYDHTKLISLKKFFFKKRFTYYDMLYRLSVLKMLLNEDRKEKNKDPSLTQRKTLLENIFFIL